MDTPALWTEANGGEDSAACPCCGRLMPEGEGWLCSPDGDLADYGYQWTDGHESRFVLGIAPLDEEGMRAMGVAVVACRREAGQLVFTVLDPEDAPWQEGEHFGPILDRRQLLEEQAMPQLFALAQAIAAHEPRLAERIAADP